MSLTYSAAVEQTITAGEQIHQIVNGTATTEVTVEDGSKVPSIRKALLDNFYFKDPIAWQVGQTENVFNQLRKFTDGSWWYAPSATASNPISMGSTPVGDPLWKIYDFDAIGKLEPRIDESLRRSYAEVGYNVVGTFQAGFTIVNSNDVGIDLNTGKGYTGTVGTVVAGTNPASGGFTDQSGKLLRPEITGRYAYVGRSLYDVLTESERTRVIANDSTFDLTAKIQSLINQSGTFYLMQGCNHYCSGSLRMKSGSKMLGSVPSTNSDAGSTTLIFDENTTTVGIYLNNVGSDTHDWAIEGIGIRPKTLNVSKGFKCLKVDSTGGMSYGFRLYTDVSNAHTGIEIGKDFWGGELNLHIRNCYKSYEQKSNTFSTSLSGWVKVSFCFQGPVFDGLIYSNINLWTDKVGLTANPDVIAQSPTDELPVCLTLKNTRGLNLTWGTENSKAQLLNMSNYSTASIALMYYNSATNIFVKDPARISNIPLAEQSVIFMRGGSSATITGLVMGWSDSAGYPAPQADPTAFFSTAATGDRNRLILKGCFITAYSYPLVNDTTKLSEISASAEENTLIGFSPSIYTNAIYPRFSLGAMPWLKLGTKTDNAYHNISTTRAYSDGQVYAVMSGSSTSTPVQFKDVNGSYGNAASCGIRAPSSSVTSRSINAGGTVNTSGADYAEYMTKADGCGEIAKGDICGVNNDGLLTDKFDDAIAFVVKSTDPSFVGGDTWFTEQEPDIPLDADGNSCETDEYISCKTAYAEAIEVARQKVDRIAFSGQVPCNVLGAKPGDYILPVRQSDGTISGVAVTNPDFSQYQLCVGKVWKVRDNGMAWISIKIG